MEGYEYKQLRYETDFGFFSGTGFDEDDMTRTINQLGAEGWELVSVYTIEKVKGGTKYVVAALKRRIRGE